MKFTAVIAIAVVAYLATANAILILDRRTSLESDAPAAEQQARE
jgi:hypothetical protein